MWMWNDYGRKSFFDSVSHEWLIKFLEHRIGDERVLRLVHKWLKAGVMEQGELTVSEQGTRARRGRLAAVGERVSPLRL
jgi:retron-type reverse transcriptase